MLEKAMQFKELIPFMAACLVAFNMILSVAYKALDKVVHMTESKADDKVWSIIGKLADWSQKLIDLVGMNPEHK